MNIARFHIEYQLTVDKRDSSAVPELEAEVIDYFLNEAQERYIKSRYESLNVYKAGFEAIQKRTDDLRSIVKTEDINTAVVAGETNTFKAVLSGTTSPYMFYIRGRANMVKTGCANKTQGVNLVRHDSLDRILLDPFNKPNYGNVVAYFEDSDFFVITDGTFTVPSVKITFLKRPNLMNVGSYGGAVVDCELPEHTHKEIVQYAADITFENIESKRLETVKRQLLNIE